MTSAFHQPVDAAVVPRFAGFSTFMRRPAVASAEGLDIAVEPGVQAFVVPLGAEAKSLAVRLVGELRAAGVSADTVYGDRGLKGAMKAADRSGARYAVVLGERDLAAGEAQVKDLTSGEQVAVPLDQLVQHLATAVG